MEAKYIPFVIALFFGVGAGLTTLFLKQNQFEIFVWLLLIVIISIYSNYQFGSQKYRMAFIISVITGITITLTHLIFVKQYLVTHSNEIQILDKILISNSYRLTLIVIAPAYWIILGILTKLTIVVIEKVIKRISPNR
jgi:hypothetical protein